MTTLTQPTLENTGLTDQEALEIARRAEYSIDIQENFFGSERHVHGRVNEDFAVTFAHHTCGPTLVGLWLTITYRGTDISSKHKKPDEPGFKEFEQVYDLAKKSWSHYRRNNTSQPEILEGRRKARELLEQKAEGDQNGV